MTTTLKSACLATHDNGVRAYITEEQKLTTTNKYQYQTE